MRTCSFAAAEAVLESNQKRDELVRAKNAKDWLV
jgi:hypothetical protein